MSATGIDVSAVFSDAMRSGSDAVNAAYHQNQQMMASRRDIMTPQQNPYANVPNPSTWGGNQPQQYQGYPQAQQYQSQPPYNYGYPASNTGYGCGSAQPVDSGYLGFSNPMYGKDPSMYRGGY